MWMDAATVARQGYAAVMAGRPVEVNGTVNTAIAAVGRLVPERLAQAVLKHQAHRLRNLL
jgi:hypothetical protein